MDLDLVFKDRMNRTYLLSLKVVEVSTELYPDSTVPKLLMSSAIDGTGESRKINREKNVA